MARERRQGRLGWLLDAYHHRRPGEGRDP